MLCSSLLALHHHSLHSDIILWPGVECIFEAHRWVNSMDSEADCGNWRGFSQPSWWWKSQDFFSKLPGHTWWNAFWGRGLRWWRACIDISIQTCQSLIELSHISAPYLTQGSRTTRCGQHGSTFRMHSYAQSVYSFVRLYDRGFEWLTCCCFAAKSTTCNGFAAGTWSLDQEFQKISSISCGWESVWKTYGKPQALDQLEEWIKETPIPYMYHDNLSQEGIFHY